MKFLLWALIGLAIVIWIWHGRQRSSGLPPSTGQGAGIPPDRIEAMVRCARCGIHLPSSEAVTGESGVYFCCDEHRRGSVPG